MAKARNYSFGVHSPLVRGNSKYDLIEMVHYDSEIAWVSLEKEASQVSKSGADYLLVHFPYFKGESENSFELIEKGLKRLAKIKDKYNIEIVCEPKLGMNRSINGINYLHESPVKKRANCNIKLCIDIGDYLMATESEIFKYIAKWREFIKVVHLHNVIYEDERYIWTPVHPIKQKNEQYEIEHIIKELALLDEVAFVFEHTPDTKPTDEYVAEGVEWIKNIITG